MPIREGGSYVVDEPGAKPRRVAFTMTKAEAEAAKKNAPQSAPKPSSKPSQSGSSKS